MRWYDEVFLVAIFAFGYVMGPIALVWGWIRWFKEPKLPTVPATLSFCGFLLATSSALLVVVSIAHAQMRHGFDFYDRRLMRYLRIGSLLSSAGFLISLCAFGAGIRSDGQRLPAR